MDIPNYGTTVNYPYAADLKAWTIGYKNPDGSLIAEKVLPYAGVKSTTYVYNSYPDATFFSVPENMVVGRFSKTQDVTWEAKQEPASLETHALQTPIPVNDKIQPGSFQSTQFAVQQLWGCHDRRHELDVASLVTDPDTYPATNKLIIANAADKWSAPSSDPIVLLENIINEALVPFDTLVCGPDVWLAISRHPEVVKTILGNANTKGRVTKAEFAEVLDLSGGVIVGKGRVDIAEPGATGAVFKRCWASDVVLFCSATSGATVEDFSFGLTAQINVSGMDKRQGPKREILSYFDPKVGALGSWVYRVTHNRKPHIMAPRLGYLIKGAV
jgi:hypothetical protein